MKKSLLLMSITLAFMHARAQNIGPSTINAAGGRNTISGNEFEWSVGEMALVSTFSSPSIIVTQGVLQPTDKPTSVTSISAKNAAINIFPNPSSTILNMQISPAGPSSYTYRLMDMTGKILLSKKSEATSSITEQINMTAFACASYMLEVTLESAGNTPQTTSYKIDKIN